MREVFSQFPVSISLPVVRRTPRQALNALTSKSGNGIYASADRLFKGAIFGRDSMDVADDLMHARPKLVRRILLTIASLQGEKYIKVNEEEPGKIIHEYRTPVVDGKPLDKTSRDIYERLSAIWGGGDKELAYYGSIDSTPHFIKTLSVYCQIYGLEILTEQVHLRSGKKESLVVILEDAIDWLTRHLDRSKSGLVEYHRLNPKGIENQVWKDSNEFYVHINGKPVNHDQPIASIEVQSLAYDALILSADILPSKKGRLTAYAHRLSAQVFDRLWLEDIDYFALGVDFDKQNKPRVIKTITANPAEMLDSLIFEELSADMKARYISALVREIMGTAFLTDAGTRSRALSEAELVNFWDYHGSFVTWPKETYDIAKGLRRHGLPALAAELENRLLNITRAARAYPEFFYVDERGRVLGMPTRQRYHGDVISVDSSIKPERVQAWTVSAVISILQQRRENFAGPPPTAWQRELEKEVLRHIPHMPLLRSRKELDARYPAYPYEVQSK